MIDWILGFVKVWLVYVSYRLYHRICFLLTSKLYFLRTTKNFISRPKEKLWQWNDSTWNENTSTVRGFPLMPILSRKSIHSERNCSTVNISFLECTFHFLTPLHDLSTRPKFYTMWVLKSPLYGPQKIHCLFDSI